MSEKEKIIKELSEELLMTKNKKIKEKDDLTCNSLSGKKSEILLKLQTENNYQEQIELVLNIQPK